LYLKKTQDFFYKKELLINFVNVHKMLLNPILNTSVTF